MPVAESVRTIGVSSTTNGTLPESDESIDLATVIFVKISTGLDGVVPANFFISTGGLTELVSIFKMSFE